MKIATLFIAACALSALVHAKEPPNPPADANQSQLIEQGHYKNKSGQDVHSPAHSKDGTVPQGASAKCRDGTYSFSKHRSGTCSGHGGVAQWLG